MMIMWRNWNAHPSSLVSIKLYNHIGKDFSRSFKKINILFPYDLATPLLGI